jgi:phosphate transporter
MGGISLGKAVVSSGLIDTMDVVIRDRISGLRLYEVVLALTAVVVVSPGWRRIQKPLVFICLL